MVGIGAREGYAYALLWISGLGASCASPLENMENPYRPDRIDKWPAGHFLDPEVKFSMVFYAQKLTRIPFLSNFVKFSKIGLL